LLGGDPNINRERITEEELRDLVTAHEALTRDERALIDEVFQAGERQLREVMVPRTEVEFLDAGWSVTKAVSIASQLPHSRFPVVRGSHDEVVGFVHVRDLYGPSGAARRGLKVGDLARDVLLLPATKKVLPSLSEMRKGGHHLAVIVDEYGGTAGIVTLEDLIEELIGEIRDEYDIGDVEARRMRGGDVVVDGLLNLDEFAEVTGHELPDGPYETVAGCLMASLGRLPRIGDAVEVDSVRLKVSKMDGRRVARVRVTVLDNGEPDESGENAVDAS
jgi:putative hemolysin